MRGMMEAVIEFYTRLQEFNWISLVGATRDEVSGWVKEFYAILPTLLWDDPHPIICI